MKYSEYLKTDHWRNLRIKVLARDKFKCTNCGCINNLHIHHLTYEHLGNENLNELITLCNICHLKIHGKNMSINEKCSFLYTTFENLKLIFLNNFNDKENIIDINEFVSLIKNDMHEITRFVKTYIYSQWEYMDTEQFILNCFFKVKTNNDIKLGYAIRLYNKGEKEFKNIFCAMCKNTLKNIILNKIHYYQRQKRDNKKFNFIEYNNVIQNDYLFEDEMDDIINYSYYLKIAKQIKLSKKETLVYNTILKHLFVYKIFDKEIIKCELKLTENNYRKLFYIIKKKFNKNKELFF